ncbi:MAG: phosphatase PAP2-related protein [Candidatus Vogelbacteria bacterium]|nr:phosphatase PAP2-related protein [Candidatus Vogelbacteria bacterium]
MDKIKANYKNLDRLFARSFLVAIALFAVSLALNYFTSAYATSRAGAPVGDIILDNIPVFDLDFVFAYGPVLFWLVMAGVLFCEPKKIPFVIKSIALFVVVRSIFVTLSHLGVSPADLPVDFNSNFIKRLSYGGDLFFSGHTGMPFLMALIFWQNKRLRIFCLVSSVFFGAVVLAVHMHYSIDVLSAFFITYTIYHLAETFFRKDKELFNS